MRLGFLGTGTITEAIVTGLGSVPGDPHPILLSPRNARVAAGLAARYANVRVCATNQEVLDGSELVVLAVRPQDAEAVLSTLRFSAQHQIVSLIAGYSVERLRPLVAPAAAPSRAVPLPSVAHRRSPIAIYPPGGAAATLLAPLGQLSPVEVEAQLSAFNAVTSTMAAYFGFVGRIADWLARQGVPAQQAREYMALVYIGLAEAGLEASLKTYDELATAHSTPGGLNEQLLRHLREHGALDTLDDALEAVYRRALGSAS